MLLFVPFLLYTGIARDVIIDLSHKRLVIYGALTAIASVTVYVVIKIQTHNVFNCFHLSRPR